MASDRVEIETANCEAGSVGDELNAIRARVNGVDMPLVFIDTGSQHNLMTVAAARATGVRFGPERDPPGRFRWT